MKPSNRLLTGLLILVFLAPAPPGFGNPVGETVVTGRIGFDRSRPGQLIVNQASQRAIINWSEFSIARGEMTSFVMPSSSASVLNRVVGVNPSQLFGTLRGNGHVYIINPNGILIGRHGMVNTRSLTASTLDVSDAAYLAGASLRFSGASTAGIRNEGQIRALGGDVFLIGHQVDNAGRIEAPQGKVGLAAGSEVILRPAGDDRLSVIAGQRHAPQRGPGVNNAGTIEAVSAELKAAGGNIYSLAINNGGIIRATGVRNENGRVVLVAEGGNVENSGVISAQNANGAGGSITLSAGHSPETPATLINSGTVAARGEAVGTRGGVVRLLGDQVGVGGYGQVDVSGRAGGGTALIGGETHGADARVQNAQRTFIGPNAEIRADALDRGDGGRVVVWADDVTRFYGRISARGGERGGDGGFAEVSGKQSLLYAGTADLRAAEGLIGDLLLDPKNITISDTGDPFVAGDYDFSDNPGGSVTIRNTGANSLVAALELADVTLQANNDIAITHAVDASGNANDHSLTLQAGRQITIDANVTLRGSFTAVANHSGADLTQRDAGPASLTMGNGVAIDTSANGPHAISISYDDGVAGAPANMTDIGGLVIGTLTSGGGAISLHAANANEFDPLLDLQGPITSGGGAINLTAGQLNLSGSLNSGSGVITVAAVNGRNLVLGGDGGLATLSIDDGELSRITTSGGLKLVSTLDAALAPGQVTVQSASGPALVIDSAGSVRFDEGPSTFSSLVVSAGTSIDLGANITTSGAQTYDDSISLLTEVILAGTSLSLGQLEGNDHNLTLTFSGETRLDGINFTGVKDLRCDGGGSTFLNGGTIATSGSQTYLDNVELETSMTLQGTALSLETVLGGGFSLTLSGSGATTLNGSLSRLMDFTSDGGGSTLINAAVINASGSQQYNDDVRLGTDVELTGSGVVFNGTLDSAAGTSYSLQVNAAGLTAFQGAVGGSDRLSAITTDLPGSTVLAGSIRLNGAATTFHDQVLLTANTTIDEAGNGNVIFNNTVDSVSGNNFALTINTPGGGETIFNGAIGANSLGLFSDPMGLGALTTDAIGVTRLNAGTVRTTGNQTYRDAVTLGTDTTLNGTDISFQGTLDSAAGSRHNLGANASGVTLFRGAIGGTDRLAALNTDAPGRTELASTLRLDGSSSTFQDAVLLTANTTIDQAGPGDVIFGGTVDSAVGNNFALTVNTVGGGATIFNGAIGNDALGALSDNDGLGSLTTDAPGRTELNGGMIRTTGGQNYNDAVVLGADTTLAGIDIWFLETLDSAMGSLRALTVNAVGATRFQGIVGATDRLSALTTDAAGRTELGGSSVNVNGINGVTFNDRVLVTADTTVNQGGAGSVTFNQTVDSGAAGNFTLTVNTPAGANTVFNAAIGTDALGALSANTGLGGLTTDASGSTAINGGMVRTSTDQNFNDPVTLGANTTLSGEDVLFNHTLNSAPGQLRSLTVNASGVTAFNAQVGAIDPLSAITTDAAGRTELGAGTLNLNSTTASFFNDPVLLTASLTINVAGGGLGFATVDSRDGMNAALTINTPAGGNTAFDGSVGGDALGALSDDDGLGSFTSDGQGRTLFRGAVVRTIGNQNHGDGTVLGMDVTFEAAQVTLSEVMGDGNDLTVTADAIALTAGQAITVPRLTLQPRTAGYDIDLGTETAGRLSITQAELDNVTAAVVQIGSLASGTLFLTAPISLNAMKVPTLRLAAGSGIHGTTAPLTVNNLAFQSAGNVDLSAANRIQTLAGVINLNGRSVTICDVINLAIGTVDGLIGIKAGDATDAANGNITLLADNMALGQRVDAGSGQVVLQAKTSGRAIDLGTETAGRLSLTAAELGQVSAGTLKIGDGSTAAMTISGGLDFGVNASSPAVRTLSLESGGTIAETEDGWIQVKNLGLRSPSHSGVVLDNPQNDWERLGADVPNGPLLVRDMGGYASAGAPPNDIDGLSGISSSGFDPRSTALEGIAAVTYTDVPSFWPRVDQLELGDAVRRPSGFEEQGLIWTSYLHLPSEPPEPARKLRKLEDQTKWTPLSVSGSTSGPGSRP